MAYDLFTQEKVFDDQSVNVLCNRIFHEITENFLVFSSFDKFALTGSVARILQGEPVKSISVIAFITDSTAIYNFCANDLAIKLRALSIKFQDRIQMDVNGVFVEFWIVNDIGTINSEVGIEVQDPADIPSNIK